MPEHGFCGIVCEVKAMREILFRGKRKDNGEWVHGSLITETSPFNKNMVMTHIYDNGCNEILVDPRTIGQYTGLTDKNGTRIFEGDIVDVNNALLSGQFWVEYRVPGGAFIVKDKDDRRFLLGGCNCTVIGNIYDNPELIKE